MIRWNEKLPPSVPKNRRLAENTLASILYEFKTTTTERPARQNLTGRWIARNQHGNLCRSCTYQLGGESHFFSKF
ncbi:MAG: hypothetical protein AAGA73_14030, partial [Pseudomonadota bacterium]